MFPDLYPVAKGSWGIMMANMNARRHHVDTHSKYITRLLNGPDPRFRLHWVWPFWVYLQLEKERIHGFSARQIKSNQTNAHARPTAAQLLRQSVYNGRPKINEKLTSPIPSSIRTSAQYFHNEQLKINTMISAFDIPTLFVTLTMAEGHWSHLRHILENTDNRDTNPTNRPYHTTLHFYNRFSCFKKQILSKPTISQFGNLLHYFDRFEFQNRQAIHTHSALWTQKSCEELIRQNYIRANIPCPIQEPELHEKVISHQIHVCRQNRCGGPAPPGSKCEKGFPEDISQTTYYDATRQKYIYRRINEQDRYVFIFQLNFVLNCFHIQI